MAGPLHECSEANWEQVINVDLKGVWLCLKHEVRQMLQQDSGAIVNISSAADLTGFSVGLAAYVAAKHGVVGLTKSAALEYATSGIRINAVCPGVIRTAMLDHAIREGALTEDAAGRMNPVQRLGTPAEIAESVIWLCSDAASFITGHAMAVDGALTAGIPTPS